jgi:hypothetical protein
MSIKGKVWLIGTPLVLAGVCVYWLFERATLYQCTACFAENPSHCTTHKDTAQDYSVDEWNARTAARIELCADDDGAKADACDKLPPERFNVTCSSWKEWVFKRSPSPYLVH